MDQKQLTNSLSFNGRGGEFFGIWIVNILLSILTLGIYSAWAKVRTKRYFYGNTHVDGDSFEYHAQPMQILKGRLVAFALLIILSIANSFFPTVSLLLFGLFYLAVPWLLWSNARFDCAMTSYRNVHFSFNAPLKQAYKTLLGRGIVSLIILLSCMFAIIQLVNTSMVASIAMFVVFMVLSALLNAWYFAGAHRYFVNGYQYGDWKFSADIELGFFIKTYLIAFAMSITGLVIFALVSMIAFFGSIDFTQIQSGDLLSLAGSTNLAAIGFMSYGVMILLGLVVTGYTTTCVRNYIFAQLESNNEMSEAEGYNFASKLTVSSYIWLVVSNFLLQVVTLGLARPWVMVRTSKYLADRTAVIGDMSQLIARDEDSNVESAVSDEVAQAFDLGIGIN